MLSKCEYVSTADFDKYRKIHCKDVLATQFNESSLKRYMRRVSTARVHRHAVFLSEGETPFHDASPVMMPGMYAFLFDNGFLSREELEKLAEDPAVNAKDTYHDLFSDVEIVFSQPQSSRYHLRLSFYPTKMPYRHSPEALKYNLIYQVEEFLPVQPDGKITSPTYADVKIGRGLDRVEWLKHFPRPGISTENIEKWVCPFPQPVKRNMHSYAQLCDNSDRDLVSVGIPVDHDGSRISYVVDDALNKGAQALASAEVRHRLKKLKTLETDEPEKFQELQLQKAIQKTNGLLELVSELQQMKTQIDSIISGLSKDTITQDTVNNYRSSLDLLYNKRANHAAFFRNHMTTSSKKK